MSSDVLYLYNMTQLIAVRIPDDMAERLETLSRTTRRPKSVYVREALEAHLARIEWEQGIITDVEAVHAGRMPTYSLDEVKQHLGLDS